MEISHSRCANLSENYGTMKSQRSSIEERRSEELSKANDSISFLTLDRLSFQLIEATANGPKSSSYVYDSLACNGSQRQEIIALPFPTARAP